MFQPEQNWHHSAFFDRFGNSAGFEVQPRKGIDVLSGQNNNSESALVQFAAYRGRPVSAFVGVLFGHERLYGLIHERQPLAKILRNLAAYIL